MTRRLRAFRDRLVASSLPLALVVLSGCGGSDATNLSGTLLRNDGTPLAGARVILRSAETGHSAYGTTDASGRFEIRIRQENGDVSGGEYHVAIVEDLGDVDTRRAPTIARKYRDSASSDVIVRVEAGESNEFNLTLDAP